VDAFLRALDERRMIAKLIYFRPERDELFNSGEAMLSAANQFTDWLIARNHRHALLSVATDWYRRGWRHDDYVPRNLELLIESIRDRFQVRKADFALPIVVSAGVNLAPNSRLIERADVVMVQAEGLALDARKIERPEIVVAEPGDQNDAAPEAALRRASGWLGVLAAPAGESSALASIERLIRVRPPKPARGRE
jgi:hypothetical protein